MPKLRRCRNCVVDRSEYLSGQGIASDAGNKRYEHNERSRCGDVEDRCEPRGSVSAVK